MKNNPLEVIKKNLKNLTNAQKQIGDYIIQHPSEVVFMTINQLSEQVGTSTTTIMRLTANLGYSGYSELQQGLKSLIINEDEPQKRLEKNLQEIDQNNLWSNCVNFNIDKIEALFEVIDTEMLNEVVSIITNANHIYCLGVRSGVPVSQYLSYGLNRTLGNCSLMSTDNLIDEFNSIHSNDIIIATSFPRYVKNLVNLVSVVKREKNVKVISFTDNYRAPIVDYSDIVLPCNSDSLAFHNSPISALIVADYLISAIAINNPEKTKERLNKVNSVMTQFDYHYNSK
ncbi:MurR/RpiR family transcriptional regulator [Oceanobacillus jeddahense]|uniref:MurR/RpiR family transcriptional regulator n=1 Tax=Oceanobacillus jeddahense TaxID=1462527 RepID=UPI000596136B|nr:MurR/RpiR family transcriptional regulator [Oceanobacillus jeddahense]